MQIHIKPWIAAVLKAMPLNKRMAMVISKMPTKVKNRAGVKKSGVNEKLKIGLSDTSLKKSGWRERARTPCAKKVTERKYLIIEIVFGFSFSNIV